MKYLNRSLRTGFFVFVLGWALALGASAQEKTLAVKEMIESHAFIFHAQTAIPLSGRSQTLTTPYDLTVSKNSIIAELPFFGRAYSLPYGATEGGFHFTSTKFEYLSTRRKKGGWDITIKPKDIEDFRQFSLSLSESGYGTLQVISNNRQPISFTGYVGLLKK